MLKIIARFKGFRRYDEFIYVKFCIKEIIIYLNQESENITFTFLR